MSDTAAHFSQNDVVATYPGPEEARAAMLALERKGVDGGAIELIEQTHDPVTNDEQRKVDMAATGAVGRRFTAVSFVVAIAGAGLGALLGYLISGDSVGLGVGALGGFIVGGLLGFLYGGYTGIATNPEFGDTFIPATGPVSVAVHATDEHQRDTAIEALRGTDARRLAVAGPDGRLQDVA